ncbi:DUF368 domain-containing protein [Nocardia rhizosphaerae]|uniref:DUF368 domain-containing protein n=1 Tax=Nocardia rhizosphaerae TaxID=1691571 RepID=A0ABV8L002_9NOCA
MSRSTGSYLLDALRGGLMGTAEVVPGVSGGTVALVTGMYDRLILSAGHTVSSLKLLVTDVPKGRGTQRAAQEFRHVDLRFLLAVMAGMIVAALTAAKLVVPLVENHPQRTFAFFFGLVLASLWVPYSESGRRWSPREWIIAALVAVAAFVLSGLPPQEIDDPNPLLVVGIAAVAICALVLPGVSGSFVLLATGIYTVTFNALNDRDLGYIALFGFGAILGLSCFVKLLQWVLEHHHRITMVIMTGLLAGSLRALWPWQPWGSDSRELQAPSNDIPITVALMVAGWLVVVAIIVIERRTSAAHLDNPTGTAIEQPNADSTHS